MTAPDHIPYQSWSRFKADMVQDTCGQSTFIKGRFLFRGQADADWPLVTSFDRRFSQLVPAERVDLARRMIETFRQESVRSGDRSAQWSDIVTAQVAQHYGMPTRLLDWSTSPYIAAFFAFADVLRLRLRDKVAIWVLDSTAGWLADNSITVFPAKHGLDERMRNQNGWFVFLQDAGDPLDTLVGRARDPRILRKMVVPAEEAVVALTDLDAMGINSALLFPGWEGFAKGAELRALMELSGPAA